MMAASRLQIPVHIMARALIVLLQAVQAKRQCATALTEKVQ